MARRKTTKRRGTKRGQTRKTARKAYAPKRRGSARRNPPAKRRRKARKNPGMGELVQAAGAGAVGAVVSNYAPALLPGAFGDYAAPAVNIGVGLFLNRKNSKMKTAGKVMVAVGIFELVKKLLPGPAPKMVVSSSAWLPASSVLPPQLQAPRASQLPAETWLADFEVPA